MKQTVSKEEERQEDVLSGMQWELFCDSLFFFLGLKKSLLQIERERERKRMKDNGRNFLFFFMPLPKFDG